VSGVLLAAGTWLAVGTSLAGGTWLAVGISLAVGIDPSLADIVKVVALEKRTTIRKCQTANTRPLCSVRRWLKTVSLTHVVSADL